MKIMRSKTPRASAVRADVSSGIDAIIARCLEIDAPERFQTVAELAWALSTVGTPHARDSAARISRVFDKQSSEHPEATPSGTLRSTVPPPVVNGVARRRHGGARSGARHTAAAIACAAVLGAASVFGVLALRSAVDASVATAPAYEQPVPGAHVSEDAAVAIAPRMRPAAAPLAVPVVVVPAAVVPAVIPAPAGKAASHATLVAASVPGRSPTTGPASLPAPAPASKPGAGLAGALAAEPLRAAEPNGGAVVGGDPTHGGGGPAVSPSREEATPPPDVE
jgi:hypothetical protein